MKKLAYTLLGLILGLGLTTQAATILFPSGGGTGIGSATVGDIGKCLKVLTSSPFTFELGACGGAGSATWGGITGTLSNQTDLQNALNGKINVGTTSVNSITTLSNLSITKSQVSDFGTYLTTESDPLSLHLTDWFSTTTQKTISSLPALSITKSQVSDFGGPYLTGTKVDSFNTRTGAVSLTSADVTGALTFTPYNATNPNNYIALGALSGTAPITYNNGTGAIGCTTASSGTAGCLSSTMFDTFNGKESTLTFNFPLSRSSNTISFTTLLSTSSVPTLGQLVYWTGIGTPSTLGSVATTSLTATAPIALSQPISVLGSLASAISCATANTSTAGCLTSADWNTFNGKPGFPFTVNTGYNSTTSTIGFITGGLFSTASSTFSSSLFLSSLSQGALYTGTNGRVQTTATTSLTATAPLSLSQPISVFGGSASALTCATATASIAGCLAAADFSKFNSATTTFSTGLTYTAGTNAVTLTAPVTIALGGTNSIVAPALNSLMYYNGTSILATSSSPLYVTSIIATSTVTNQNSQFQNASTTKLSINNIAQYDKKIFGFKVATSTTWTATTTAAEGVLPALPFAATVNSVSCYTDVASGFLNVDTVIGSTHLALIPASSTPAEYTFTANNTIAQNGKWYVQVGTSTTSTTKGIACTYKVTPTGI